MNPIFSSSSKYFMLYSCVHDRILINDWSTWWLQNMPKNAQIFVKSNQSLLKHLRFCFFIPGWIPFLNTTVLSNSTTAMSLAKVLKDVKYYYFEILLKHFWNFYTLRYMWNIYLPLYSSCGVIFTTLYSSGFAPSSSLYNTCSWSKTWWIIDQEFFLFKSYF